VFIDNYNQPVTIALIREETDAEEQRRLRIEEERLQEKQAKEDLFRQTEYETYLKLKKKYEADQ
jgi:hypothetical protein